MIGFDAVISRAQAQGLQVRVHRPDGRIDGRIDGAPDFDLFIRNDAGLEALQTLNELDICEAYIRGDLDMEGDLVKAFAQMRAALSDNSPWLKIWRRLHPLLVGRERLNPGWIAKHYDSGNVQLIAQDLDYNTYTQGIYEDEEDSMEVGAERKLRSAFESLRLKAGDSLLEVGCGWGGFTRYCARRGVKVTGITLSKDQLAFTQARIDEEKLDARALYQDFFTFAPGQRFDAISLMGVIEDLSDYPRVMERLAGLLKPGGRIYLDFAAAVEPFATSSFITRYVWPGTFRMVYMPEFVSAVTHAPFELIGIYNDRRNYHLWAKKGHARWVEKKDEVVAASSIETWRLFRLLFAGTAGVMDSPNHKVTAFRVVLEHPADVTPRPRRLPAELDALASRLKMRINNARA